MRPGVEGGYPEGPGSCRCPICIQARASKVQQGGNRTEGRFIDQWATIAAANASKYSRHNAGDLVFFHNQKRVRVPDSWILDGRRGTVIGSVETGLDKAGKQTFAYLVRNHVKPFKRRNGEKHKIIFVHPTNLRAENGRRRRLGWKPSDDIPRRHDYLHPLINRILRESERSD